MRAVRAYLSYSVDTKCPYCGENVDIAENDDDYIVAKAIFNNNWGKLKGYVKQCPHCEKEFQIEEVEY